MEQAFTYAYLPLEKLPTTPLPEGAPVEILGPRQVLEGGIWIQVKDIFGRTGWLRME